MKRAIVSLVLAGFLVVALSPLAFAGANANAKIQLHVGPKITKVVCLVQTSPTVVDNRPNCNAIVTKGALYPPNVYFTYLIVTDYDVVGGIAGGQCGISYTGGVTVFTWNFCASLQFPNDPPNAWPASGGGNLWTWDASSTDLKEGCQKSPKCAVAGYFYMGCYSPGGTMCVTKRPVDNLAKVASCASFEDNICGSGDVTAPCTGTSHLGCAAFSAGGVADGYNPCGLITPAKTASWGAIKGIYR
jgi:hypothetical protein